jgi:hypothetical protein
MTQSPCSWLHRRAHEPISVLMRPSRKSWNYFRAHETIFELMRPSLCSWTTFELVRPSPCSWNHIRADETVLLARASLSSRDNLRDHDTISALTRTSPFLWEHLRSHETIPEVIRPSPKSSGHLRSHETIFVLMRINSVLMRLFPSSRHHLLSYESIPISRDHLRSHEIILCTTASPFSGAALVQFNLLFSDSWTLIWSVNRRSQAVLSFQGFVRYVYSPSDVRVSILHSHIGWRFVFMDNNYTEVCSF